MLLDMMAFKNTSELECRQLAYFKMLTVTFLIKEFDHLEQNNFCKKYYQKSKLHLMLGAKRILEQGHFDGIHKD